MHALNSSIKSSYFHLISTGVNKSFDLFWEQRVGGSNPLAPTSIKLDIATEIGHSTRTSAFYRYIAVVDFEAVAACE